MKILLATSTVTHNAGIPSFNRELRSLLDRNNEIDLLVDEDISYYDGYGSVYTTSKVDINSFKSCKKLLSKINEQSYDLIINSNSHAAAILTPFFNDNTRILTISHSLGTLDCDNAVYNHKYIDGIIALSNNCKKYITTRFKALSTDKVYVIYNSVASIANACDLRAKKITNKTLSIVFAGGTAPSKSPEIAVKILRRLCETNLDFKFYWLGNSTPPLKKLQPYKDIQAILPKDDRIIITGRIPQSEATKIIASCNIFLAPSKREGFPMALLEAMRIGCIPIIADYDIANKEVIENGITGYVIKHNDIDSFFNRIFDIITNSHNYIEIYDKTYQKFSTDLNFDVWHKKITKVVTQIKHTHKKRLSFSFMNYFKSLYGFKLLDVFNLVENHIKEVLPSALEFWKIYKHKQ